MTTALLTCEGAPECFRNETDHTSKRKILDARPSKDIWSLGCLYSEALVWSVLGRNGLSQYEEERRATTDGLVGLQNTAYEICFHDGQNVLETVHKMHARVRREHRRNDFVVGEVAPLVEDMLLTAAKRPDANEVYERSKRALAAAIRCSNLEPDWSYEPPIPRIFQTQPRPPLQLPPEVLAAQQRSDPRGTGNVANIAHFGSPSSSGSDVANDAHRMPGVRSGYFSEYIRESAPTGKTKQAQRSKSSQKTRSCQTKPRYTSKEDERMYLEDVAQDVTATTAFDWQNSAPNTRHTRKYGSGDLRNPNVATKSSMQCLGTGGNREEFPKATVDEFANWINKKRANAYTPPFPGLELLDRLDGRDQVFIYPILSKSLG
jgi:hypothetical protein